MNDPAATSRKGYWSQEDFSAPRIGRSAAVATDLELIAELRKRGERDPKIMDLMRLVVSLTLEKTLPEAGPAALDNSLRICRLDSALGPRGQCSLLMLGCDSVQSRGRLSTQSLWVSELTP